MAEFDWVMGGSIFLNILALFWTFRFRSIVGGKYFKSILKQAGWRFRHPIRVVNMYKGQHYEMEIKDMETATQFDNESNNTPVSVNEGARYHDDSELKTYFFPQGSTQNFDPMKDLNEKFYELLKRIGLLNNKYLDYKEARIRAGMANKLLTKDHFHKVTLGVVVILLAIGYGVFNLNQFADGAKVLYEQWIPIIQKNIPDIPRLVPAGSGIPNPGKILGGLNGGK